MSADALPEVRTTRAGGEALEMLALPLNVQILKKLGEGPQGLMALRQAVESPPQSTMRLYSKTLMDRGLIARRRKPEFPPSVEYDITEAGQDLLGVASVLQRWLDRAPDGPIALGTAGAKNATKALTQGWSTNIVRAVAAQPLALTQLSRLIHDVSYPSLERRLSTMRLTKLVEPRRNGRATPYGASQWLRQAVVPLVSAIAWERRRRAEGTPPIRHLDVQAAFLLALPLVEMPEDFSGTIRLAVELRRGDSPVEAGVVVRFENGKLVACTPRLEGDVDARVSGPPAAWFDKLIGSNNSNLTMNGDAGMGMAMLDGLEAVGLQQAAATA